MTSRPYLAPRLNERILFCLTKAGVQPPKVPHLMMWIVAVLIGTLQPTPLTADRVGHDQWIQDLYVDIRRLPDPEFLLLKEHEEALAVAMADFIGLASKPIGTALISARYVIQVIEQEASAAEPTAPRIIDVRQLELLDVRCDRGGLSLSPT